MRINLSLASALLCMVVPICAHADIFTLTSGTNNISFFAPASPTPSTTDTVNQFALYNLTLNVNGTLSTGDAYFYTSASNGGLEIIDGSYGEPLLSQVGPQLFTGSVEAPTFLLDSFSLTSYNDSNAFNQNFALSITPTSSVTPEPSSLLLVGSGLVSVCALLRRRLLPQ